MNWTGRKRCSARPARKSWRCISCRTDGYVLFIIDLLALPGGEKIPEVMMFRRVLVATDFSRYADRTLECIGEIPGMEEILLVHVPGQLPVPESSPALRSARNGPEDRDWRLLAEKGRFLEEVTGVKVIPLLAEQTRGDIAGAIIRTANNENVSLIVMGARGKGLVRGLLLGSVSEDVINRAGIDLLVMRFRGIGGDDSALLEKFCVNVFSHILCPVDFSRPSEKTLEYIRNLGFIRKVTVVHVVKPQGYGEENNLPVPDPGERLRIITTELEQHGIRATSIIRYGDPVTEICRVADERDVSLIMLARYGKTDYTKNIPIGQVATGVAARADRPLFIISPHISLTLITRELSHDEFALAESVWMTYHQQKGDPETDRIFGVFVEGVLAAVARCRRHPDGLEVDGVYVPDDYRDRGYARKAVQALVDACGSEPLYMHSTLPLARFYSSFGFRQISEGELPRSIKERFNFAEGDLEGANVVPMGRPGSL
jgi:nucleotide-binding universal stress UspA family protein/GNAT superfamily N-acetyltransferase